MAYDNMITRADVAALVPEEVAKELQRTLPAKSAALTMFRRATMSRKVQRQPVMALLPQAYWVGGDTGMKQTTKAAWDNKYLTAEELAVIVPIPQAVLDDADFDIWAEIKPSLEEAAGALIDAAALFGVNKPASWPTAILPGAIAAGNYFVRGSVIGEDLASDINVTMGMVEADGYPVTGFAGDVTMKAALRGLRDANGGLLFQPSLTAGTPSTVYGEPLAYIGDNGSWVAADADLIAGDFSRGIIAVRQDFTYTIHKDGVISDDDGVIILNLMQQDAVAMRMVMRVGFQIANPISRRKPVFADATRFPFAALVPDAP